MSAPEYLTINEFPVGTTGLYEFEFAGGYLEKEHVKLDFVTSVGARTNYPLDELMFVTEFTLQIPSIDIPANAVSVRIYRETPRGSPLLNFTNGARLNERNLDRLAAQTIFVAAEAFDAGAFAVAEDLIGQALQAIQDAQDALAAASGIEAGASASAAAALASQTAAAASAALALTRANNSDASATASAASALAASNSAVAALASQNAAAASAAAALASQNAASASQTAAAGSATAAAGSASTASTQATNASNSASAASGSASAAATSASNAATSATNAATSATTAQSFATGLSRVTGAVTRANLNGKVLVTTVGVTIPASEFQDGDVFGIENDSAAAVTITQGSGLTLYNAASAASGNRVINARGFMTVRFKSGTIAYASGPGVL